MLTDPDAAVKFTLDPPFVKIPFIPRVQLPATLISLVGSETIIVPALAPVPKIKFPSTVKSKPACKVNEPSEMVIFLQTAASVEIIGALGFAGTVTSVVISGIVNELQFAGSCQLVSKLPVHVVVVITGQSILLPGSLSYVSEPNDPEIEPPNVITEAEPVLETLL